MGNGNKLGVGIVGCGYQGGRLARGIALVDGLEVKACADIVPQRAEELAAYAGGASVYASAEELLAKSRVDIVMVATPHHLLAPTALLAIREGKHVLSEKPCGLSARELAEVESAAAQAGVSFLAGYSFRYIPAWWKVHELLQQGVVGEIQSVTGAIGVGSMNEGWKSDPVTGGGPLLFVGTHLIDQVLWYLQDDPLEVYASTRFRSDTQADETANFQVKFRKGAIAQLMATQTATGFISQLDIFGRDGAISLRPCGFLDYEVTVSSRIAEEYKQTAVIHTPVAGDVRDVKHSRQMADFVQAIHSGQPTYVTVQQARKVMEVVDAVSISSRRGKPVEIKQAIPA